MIKLSCGLMLIRDEKSATEFYHADKNIFRSMMKKFG